MPAGVAPARCPGDRSADERVRMTGGPQTRPTDPTITVIIPAYRAEATIARAVASVLGQTDPDFELIVSSDDRVDYLAVLAGLGVTDPRLRQVSTGNVGSGEAPARNTAIVAARGELIAPLDADDALTPDRLARLRALASATGAASDNTAVHYAADAPPVKFAFPTAPAVQALDAAAILAPRVPIFPMVARALVGPGWQPVPFAADVLFNLRLVATAARYPAAAATGYLYYKTPGSITASPATADLAEAGYHKILAFLADDATYIPNTAVRDAAVVEFTENLALNRVFRTFLADGRCRTLDEFLDLTDNGRADWLAGTLAEARAATVRSTQ